VFLLNGFDPFNATRFADLKASLHRLGFNRVYGGQFYHAGGFADEVRVIAAAEPDARFVVIGIGAGVVAAVSLADAVGPDGIAVDLLASVDSPFWSDAPGKQPANVGRVIHIHGRPIAFSPAASIGEDLELPVQDWWGVAAHPLTVERLAEELASVAGTIPAPIPEELPALDDEIPAPRSQVTEAVRVGDAWDFLKPASRLGSEGSKTQETAKQTDGGL
jgi:hypothetical protein